MAQVIQINTGLTTSDGGSVAPGSIVLFSVGFPAGKITYSAGLQVYRSMTALQNGNSPVSNIVDFKNNLFFAPSESDFMQLTPPIIYENIRAALGVIYGDANVVIITI